MFGRRIVCISGFLQPRHGRSGMARLWGQLRQMLGDHATEVTLHPWNEDWGRLAELIVDTADDPERLMLDVVAYSWGVGHGAKTLAEKLLGEGVQIRHLVACDGVYRCSWLPSWLQWRAIASPLLGEPVIRMPANVRRVSMVRQRDQLPMGHRIEGHNPGCQVNDYGFLPYPHVDIDGAAEFLNLARTIIGSEDSPSMGIKFGERP